MAGRMSHRLGQAGGRASVAKKEDPPHSRNGAVNCSTLSKTKGDHFEHNDGQGHPHLASLLATFIILAYLLHPMLEGMDDQVRLLRQKLPSCQRPFNDMRALTSYRCFDSWENLIDFMLKGWSPRKQSKNPPEAKRLRSLPVTA